MIQLEKLESSGNFTIPVHEAIMFDNLCRIRTEEDEYRDRVLCVKDGEWRKVLPYSVI